jgi:hypothetical protein
MLVMRELEREYRDLNKMTTGSLKVHEKQIASKIDRAGTHRAVQNIPRNIH